jgi:hypothetical protein
MQFLKQHEPASKQIVDISEYLEVMTTFSALTH